MHMYIHLNSNTESIDRSVRLEERQYTGIYTHIQTKDIGSFYYNRIIEVYATAIRI